MNATLCRQAREMVCVCDGGVFGEGRPVEGEQYKGGGYLSQKM